MSWIQWFAIQKHHFGLPNPVCVRCDAFLEVYFDIRETARIATTTTTTTLRRSCKWFQAGGGSQMQCRDRSHPRSMELVCGTAASAEQGSSRPRAAPSSEIHRRESRQTRRVSFSQQRTGPRSFAICLPPSTCGLSSLSLEWAPLRANMNQTHGCCSNFHGGIWARFQHCQHDDDDYAAATHHIAKGMVGSLQVREVARMQRGAGAEPR